MQIAMYLYAAVALIVALRLAIYIVFSLDKYDRRDFDVGMAIFLPLIVCLWPLIFFKPRLFFNPAKSGAMKNEGYDAVLGRDIDRLTSGTLPAAPLIVFDASKVTNWEGSLDAGDEHCGVFVIGAESLRSLLSGTDKQRFLKAWLDSNNISSALASAAVPPSQFGAIVFLVDRVIRSAECSVFCTKCDAGKPVIKWTAQDDNGARNGSNFNRLLCGQGHLLLSYETIHILRN